MNNSVKRLLFWLLEGTKGGPTRMQLLNLLISKPRNMRQLSLAAGLDYKTVQHHIEMLEKNQVIEKQGGAYGGIYFVSDSVSAEKDFMKKIRASKGGRDEN